MKQEPNKIMAPCPFCGNDKNLGVQSRTERAVWNVAETDRIYWEHFSVRCPKCHARGPVVSGWTSDYPETRTVDYAGKPTEVRPRNRYIARAMAAWNEHARPGLYECFHCGARAVAWGSDFTLEDMGYDGEGIVHVCHCQNCGADVEYQIRYDGEEGEAP